MRRWLALGWGLLGVGVLGATVPSPMEVQSDAVWQRSLGQEVGPLVQLHLQPVPFTGGRAVHPLFLVTDEAGERHRYEVWQSAHAGSHLWVDVNTLEFSMGTGGTLWAELRGEQAQAVIAVLETPYPCADRYRMLPGPNSNSYAAWVLERSGWAVDLPEQALGQGWGCRP